VTEPRRDPQPRERLYLEDFEVGQRFKSGSYTVSEAQIKAFAAEFDPQPMHLEALAARASVFGGLVASGWHTAAITMRLIVESGPAFAGGAVGLGAEIAWPRAVRPGDTLHIDGEVIEVIPSSSRADRGRIRLRIETRNQHGEVVQQAVTNVLVPGRAARTVTSPPDG
jgi:acyl dehydratase